MMVQYDRQGARKGEQTPMVCSDKLMRAPGIRLLLTGTAVLVLWTVATASALAQDEAPQAAAKPDVKAVIEKIRAAGEPISARQCEPPAVPDKDNAFLLYKKAAAKLTAASEQVDEAASRLAKTPVPAWDRKDLDTIRSYVKTNAQAIELARNGARLPGFKSDVEWDKGFGMSLSYMSLMRNLVRLLCYQARVDLAAGRSAEAIQTCGDALRIAGHASAEPSLIGRLVEIACRDMTMGVFSQILTVNKDTAQAELILRTLTDLAPKPRLHATLMLERAMAIDLFESMRAGKMTPEDVLGSSTALAAMTPESIDADEAAYLEKMQGFIDLADKPYYEVGAKVKALDENKEQPHPIATLGETITPVLLRVFEADAGGRALNDVMRTAAAIKVYKLRRLGYPRNLTELVPDVVPMAPVDVFSGKPLLYVRVGEGFVVYSVGLNLVDDMGFPGTDKRSGDIAYTEE
jgi:hypothetical protein